MTDLVQFNLPGISPALNAAVRKRMEAEGLNRNDLVVGVLAKHYRVRFRLNSRHSGGRAVVAPVEWHLKIPKQLRRKLNAERARTDVPARDIAVRILSEEFGVPFAAAVHTERRRKSWKRAA